MSDSVENRDKTARVALVTGASRGIGRAIALALARRGFCVAVHFHTGAAGAAETLRMLQEDQGAAAANGGATRSSHFTIAADVADPKECARLLREVLERCGRLDVLCNNAGISIDRSDVLDCTFEQWNADYEATMRVNYLAAANLTFLAAKHHCHTVASAGEGRSGDAPGSPSPASSPLFRIINISSRAAHAGDPTAPAYAVSKAALNTFTQSVAKQLAPHGVLCFLVSPGAIETEMWTSQLTSAEERRSMENGIPLGRLGAPSEVAEVVAFAATDAPPFMTGTDIAINGAVYTR